MKLYFESETEPSKIEASKPLNLTAEEFLLALNLDANQLSFSINTPLRYQFSLEDILIRELQIDGFTHSEPLESLNQSLQIFEDQHQLFKFINPAKTVLVRQQLVYSDVKMKKSNKWLKSKQSKRLNTGRSKK